MAEPISSSQLSDSALFQSEWAALLECASPGRDPERLSLLLSAVDWSRLFLLAEAHGVFGILAASLPHAGESEVPSEIRDFLFERQRAQNFQTLRLTAELFRLLELFAAKGIAVLVVKGPVLAVQAYEDPTMRYYGDLDLLIRQRDVRGATESLTASGYQATVPLSAIDAGKIPGQYLFFKPESKVLVELHNELTLRYFPRPLPMEDFFSRQIRVRLEPHEVPAPCVEDELVLICVHGAKHFWERLMWVADIAGLVSRQTIIDWERARASAKAVRADHLLRTGLRLAADLLRAPLPQEISVELKSDAVAARLVARILRWLPAAGYVPPGLFERAAFRMLMRGGLLAAPAYLLRLSLSPTEEDWQASGNLSGNRFLDVLCRPFRLARKYSRKGPSVT